MTDPTCTRQLGAYTPQAITPDDPASSSGLCPSRSQPATSCEPGGDTFSDHPGPDRTTGSPDASFADRLWSAIGLADPSPRVFTRGLPIPRLERPQRTGSAYYSVSAMDTWGRLADRSPLSRLTWPPGFPLGVAFTHGAIVVVPHRDSRLRVTRQGHLRLPATMRHLLRVKAGDQFLMAAFPGRGFLIAYPMAAVDTMVITYHASLVEGRHSD